MIVLGVLSFVAVAGVDNLNLAINFFGVGEVVFSGGNGLGVL